MSPMILYNLFSSSKREGNVLRCFENNILECLLQFNIMSFEVDAKSPRMILGCANRLSRMNFFARLLELLRKFPTLIFPLFAVGKK